MRLADAYRRLHPRTSDSDDSTVHSSDSTHTNETELSPPLGDEAFACVPERVASAHESEAHDDLSTSTPPPDALRGRQAAMPPTPPELANDPFSATTLVANADHRRLVPASTSPVARRGRLGLCLARKAAD